MKADEFIEYLEEQVGQPYLCGGQHTKLTPDNYISVITRKESDPTYRQQAITYCEEKFEHGATVLYGYDCSGLGMYWLENVKHIYKTDMNANSMWGKCTEVIELKRGYWVFRFSDGKATHIGYMVSDNEVIHAKGRRFGVCRERYSSSYWHKIGKPICFDFDPVPPPAPTYKYIRVKRKCRIRDGNGVYDKDGKENKTLAIAYKGHEYQLIGQADTDPYWYIVPYKDRLGYITSNTKYTEEVNRV